MINEVNLQLTAFFLSLLLPLSTAAIKCADCVGRNCMGAFCEGDYCVLSHYAPRWGEYEWGEPKAVKGCLSGSLIRKNVRNHCEVFDEEGEEVSTCFCKNRYCTHGKNLEKLEIEPIQLVTCVCEGPHCEGSDTCLGEFCSYVTNHKTKKVEQGCLNSSVPLIERRSAGACMIPPITGAMHHTLAKNADDLLVTESCVCAEDYCNDKKPEVTVQENMKCQAFVKAKVMGTKMESKEATCTGEYCFKAKITSKISLMTEYETIGCATFAKSSKLADELNAIGCAKFESENLHVEACIKTTDKAALGRASTSTRRHREKGKSKTGTKFSKGKEPKMEVSYEDEEDNVEEEKEEKEEEEKEREEEIEFREDAKSDEKPQKATTEHYIFERPTLAPEIEENSNTTLVSVFLLIILLIALSGIVWKFQLHRRLFRANYDSVAGG